MIETYTKLTAALITGCVLSCLAGCSSFATVPSMKIPFMGEKEKICKDPTRIAVTWSPDVLVQPGRTPTRGFGGRVFFFDKNGRPVKVYGDLMVHGFKGDGTAPGQAAKRFAFTPEQFKTHLSSSDLGDSYSVWIPWDAAGGAQEKITLIATFTPVDGQAIQSGATIALLPGKTDNLSHQARLQNQARQNIATASHLANPSLPPFGQAVPATNSSPLTQGRGLTTTTITLPNSTQQLLQQAATPPRIAERPRPMPPVAR